uniref:C-type lectin domain-containing protein n=1 Tax=Fundulus heteroclitus TaxID=8078 RepID=A0A3Q2QMM4_FUNHE
KQPGNQNTRFYFVNELKNWTEAQTYCREQHADLVTIRSQENLTTLIDMVKPDEMFAWIGLHKSSWTWVDGREKTRQFIYRGREERRRIFYMGRRGGHKVIKE